MSSNSKQDDVIKLSHEECLEAMPQYINGMLGADMNRAMQEHVGRCDSCFEELCRQQKVSELLVETDDTPRELLSHTTMQKNLSSVLDRIEQSESMASTTSSTTDPAPEQTASKGSFFAGFKQWFEDWSDSARWAFAVQTCVLVACVGFIFQQQTNSPEVQQYQTFTNGEKTTATEGVASNNHLFRLIFHPQSSEAEVRALLLKVQGQITNGPSFSGVYTLAVAKESPQAEVLATLRQSPWVEFVEPVLNLAGKSN